MPRPAPTNYSLPTAPATAARPAAATKYNGTAAGDPEDPYRWDNTGPCIDVFAPGVDIYSACGGASRCVRVDDSSYTLASGTSMAVPHVAGAARLEWLADAAWWE